MYDTLELTPPSAAVATSVPSRALGDITSRAAGFGAITFATIVVFQNLIRGASAPANDATGKEVFSFYADHRPLMFVLMATYVVSGFGLAMFVGGAMRRMLASHRRGWAFAGLFGVGAVMALFTTVVGIEQALSVVAHGNAPNVGSIETLWALHNSIFAVLDVSIAIALVGLSRAGVAAGITPRTFRWLAPIAAAMLTVGTFAGPAIAAGEAMPLFGLVGVGFVGWLVFLLTTGTRLVRSGVTR